MTENSATNRIVLSFPSALSLSDTTVDGPSKSWIQVAIAGSFVSNRYGNFAITPGDLGMMATNFVPGTTPVDYDHLATDPKRPGDGIAAGWLQNLEIRDGGKSLWALVEWTVDAAKRIASREYRFISPSFVKDHIDQSGRKIGTKLLAAALTNFPFLPNMAAVTLACSPAFGTLGVPVVTATVHHLAEPGQHVTFLPDAERTPELTDEERRQTFVVKSAIGAGDDQFVRLATLDGDDFGWFRATELAPAAAHTESPLPAERSQKPEEVSMSQQAELENRAARFTTRMTELSRGRTAREAFDLAQRFDPEGAEAYRLVGVGAQVDETAPPVVSLSNRPGETFDQLALRYASEKNISLRQAVHEVAIARPDLAAVR